MSAQTYIACTRPAYKPMLEIQEWIRRQNEWLYVEFACGHDAMVICPDALAPDHVTTTDFQSALSEDHHRPALRLALSKYPSLKGLS